MTAVCIGVSLLVGMLWGFWSAHRLWKSSIRQAAASAKPLDLMQDQYVYFVHRYLQSEQTPGDWRDP